MAGPAEKLYTCLLYTSEIYTGSTSFSMSSSGGIDFSEYTGEGEWDPGRSMEHSLMVLSAADVAERTENGETRTETLRLADYYDYYPITVELYLPDQEGRSYVYTTWAECQALADYFRLKVPEDLMVEVSVTKDEYGQVSNVESNDVGNQRFWFDCRSVVVENGVCLSIAVESENMDVPDNLVACRDGFGLYFIPFSEESVSYTHLGLSGYDLLQYLGISADDAREVHHLCQTLDPGVVVEGIDGAVIQEGTALIHGGGGDTGGQHEPHIHRQPLGGLEHVLNTVSAHDIGLSLIHI